MPPSPASPAAPRTATDDLAATLRGQGWAVLDAASLRQVCALPPAAFDGWSAHWDDLPPDAHLLDGGRYRRRRHGSFVCRGGAAPAMVAHRAHWQPRAYNALHGGIERWFEPLTPALVAEPGWTPLLQGLAGIASALRGPRDWWGEAHAFRIDTAGGIGRPTPEGAHRDGVDLVVVLLVARHGVKGGETRVFDADGPHGVRFTLDEPWCALLLDDARVVHETTPIQPLEPGRPGWRDTLVVTLRAGGFQDPPPAAGEDRPDDRDRPDRDGDRDPGAPPDRARRGEPPSDEGARR